MAEIEKVFAGLKTRLRKFKTEWGVEFRERVEARTPVDTGEMKAGWGFTMKRDDIEIYNIALHASYVEYGTDKMAPRAPMRSTLLERNEITQVAIERSKR